MKLKKSGQIAYLNGEYLPIEKAQISTQDRGFLFGDGVYEVIPVYRKQLFTFEEHLARLKHSLKATAILNPLEDSAWKKVLQKLVDLHPWQNQFIYLQVTRGVQMQRDHLPVDCLTPTLYAYSNELKPVSEHLKTHGISVITLDDLRWLRCDIKATTLLPNVMMKMAARHQNADDAILIDAEGQVTESTASNVFIVRDGELITPPQSQHLLTGITRTLVMQIAHEHQIPVLEHPLSLTDFEQADEIWLTSTTKDALPVTHLNGNPVGDGQPGARWHQMQTHFAEFKQRFIDKTQNH